MNHNKRHFGAFFALFAAMASALVSGGATTAFAATDATVVADQVQRGGVAVVKYDVETKQSTPQGGADLAGVEFTLTNKSNQPVVYKDEYGHYRTYAAGESWVISTKWDASRNAYVAQTPTDALPYGTYHIQETKGSAGYGLATRATFLNHKYVPGYAADTTWRTWVDAGYDFTISSEGQFVTFDGQNTAVKTSGTGNYNAGPGAYNPLIRGGIEVAKRDHDLLRATPQGNADLEGATWIITNKNTYPVLVWDHFDQDENGVDHGVVAKSQSYQVQRGMNTGKTYTTAIDADGWAQPGAIVAIVHSGDDGRGQTFMDALPVGWYEVEEVEPPHGYTLEKRWISTVQIDNDDWDTLVATDCDDPILRGGVQIQKRDAELFSLAPNMTVPQGNAEFEGAEITIYNRSGKDVWIRSDASAHTGDVSGKSGRIAPGEVVAVIRTNAQGIATLTQLPYGSYEAVETKSPYGYELNDGWSWSFDITDESKMSDAGTNIVAKNDDADDLLLETVIHNGELFLYKLDAETGEPTSLVNDGDWAPESMQFSIWNQSSNAVVWNGQVYAVGEKMVGPGAKSGNPGYVTYDDKRGFAGLLLSGMPAGHYEVEETKAPVGYIRDTQHKFIDVTPMVPDYPLTFTDQVIREDLQFQKVDADTMEPMAGIPFLLEKLDDDGNTIEQHILVTDEDGMVDTSGAESGYQSWRARIVDGEEHINLADGYYDEATGEFTYEAPYADKESVLAELEGDGTDANPGLLAELGNLVSELDEYLKTANVEGIQTLYDELAEIVRAANKIAAEKGDDSAEYAAKVAEQADKIAEIHEALVAQKAAAGDDVRGQIELLEAQIAAKEDAIKAAQDRLAAIDDELSGDKAIWETGYWFFGGERTDGQKVSESMGALPYGNYRLSELRCAANQGKKLVTRTVTIKRGNGLVENLGTIDNATQSTCDPCNDRSVQGLEVDVQKTSDPAPNTVVKPGGTITYTLNYTNTSAETIAFTQIRDYIPGSTSFKSVGSGGVYVSSDKYVEWVIEDLAPGETGSVSFAVTVNKGADPIIVNQAHFGTSDVKIVAGDGLDDPYGSTNVIRHSTDGTATGPYLSAVKTATPAAGETVEVGDVIEYRITVTNLGDTKATAVGVADVVPEYTELVKKADETTDYYEVSEIGDGYMVSDRLIGWNLGSLDAGASKTVTFKVKVTDEVRQVVSNQATFGFTRGKVTGPLDNSTNIVEHAVETLPQVSVTKSCDVTGTVAPGEILTYTLHVENNGRGNAVNVPVFDIIPEGTQYVMGSASANVTFDENHVYASADGAVGEASDEVPYVSWTIPVLYNHGGSADVTYQVRVKDSVKVGDVIDNRATVGGEGPADVKTETPTSTTLGDGGFAVSNLVEHTVIDPLDDVSVVKTVKPADGSNVAAGDELTYTITWTNDGTHPVSGFAVRDAIPEHTTFVEGSIVVTGADGKTSTEIADEAKQQTEDGDECGTVEVSDSIVWTPSVAFGDGNATDPENIFRAITGGDTNEETHHVYNWKTIKVAIANLKVGESVEFEVKVDDDYDQLWRATLLEDGRLALLMRLLVPNQTDSPNFARANGVIANYDQKWKDVYALVNELKPGETGSLTFTVRVDDDVEGDVTITNKATYGQGVYAPPCFDLDHETNETGNTVGEPHLSATKSVSPEGTAKLGDTLHYTITVTNDGTARARDIAIRDEFREEGALKGVVYVPGSFTVSGGDSESASASLAASYNMASRVIVARATTLGPGESIVMQFDVNVADAFMGDVIKNKATWESDFTGDPFADDLANETNETAVTIDEARLSVTKSVDVAAGTQVSVGDTLTYTFKVKNDSSVDARGVAVYDSIPNYTTYINGSATGGLRSVADADGKTVALVADNLSIAAGAELEFSFKVSVDAALVEDVTISNRATAGFASNPTGPLDVDSNEVINDAVAPDTVLRVHLTSDPEPGTDVYGNDVITYTVEVLNESSRPTSDGAVFVYVPDHTSYVDGSATGGLALQRTSIFGGGKALVASGLELGAYGTKTFTFQVKADAVTSDTIVSAHASAGEFKGTPTGDLEASSGEVIHTIVAPKPALSITHESDPEAGTKLAAGDIVTYTFTVHETAGVAATGVAVFDYVPANTTYVDGSADGLTEIRNTAGDVIALAADGISIGAGGEVTFSFQVEVGAVPADTEIVNRPTCGFAEAPQLPLEVDAEQIAHEVIAPKPDLRITKSASPSNEAVKPGDVIDYSFTVMNESGAIARGVAVFDAIPAHTTYVDGSASGLKAITDESGRVVALYADNITLAGGRSRSFGFAVTVDDELGDGDAIVNRATTGFATAPKSDLGIASNATVNNIVTEKPGLAISHSSDPAAGTRVESGDTITYTVVVRETEGVAANGVAVFDAIPDHATYVDGSATGGFSPITDESGRVVALAADGISLDAKGSHTLTFQVTVDETDDDVELKNQPSAGFATAPTETLALVAKAIDHNVVIPKVIEAPQLQIVKAQEPGNGAWIAGGDELTYHITVTNVGNAVAPFVGIYDEAPANTEFVEGSLETTKGDVYVGEDGLLTTIAGDLAAGESVTMTFRVTVDLGFEGTIRNRAMWVSPAADPNNLGDVEYVDLDATTSAITAPAQGIIGVFGAVVPVPSGSYTGVSNEVTAGGSGSGETEPATPVTPSEPEQPANPGESNETEASVTKPEVTIVKSADVTSVKAGDVVTFTLDVTNSGKVNANQLYVADKLASGLTFVSGSATGEGLEVSYASGTVVARGTLAPGASATVTFKAKVASSAKGTVTNEATWGQAKAGETPTEVMGRSNKVTLSVATSGTTTGPVGGNSDSNEVVAFVSKPQVRIVKSADVADGATVAAGTTITYTLKADNIGRTNANMLYVEDKLADGLTFVEDSIVCDGFAATFEDGAIVARGTLAPGTSGTVTFSAKVDSDFSGDIVNVAEWGQAKPGEKPAEFVSRSNEVLTHVGEPNVELVKSASVIDGAYVAKGSHMTYKLVATNKGGVAVDLVIEDVLPAGLKVVESSLPAGVTIVDGKLVFEAGVLEAGASVEIEFEVEVTEDAVGDIVNAASWHDKTSDRGADSNSITTHVGEPAIGVTKASDPVAGSFVAPGDDIHYFVTLVNEGTVSGVARLSDKLPDGMTLDADSVKATVTDAAVAADDEETADGELDVEVRSDEPLAVLSRAFTAFVDWITGKQTEEAGFIVEGNEIRGALEIAPGETVTVSYTATVDSGIAQGSELTNKAVVAVDGFEDKESENKLVVGYPNILVSKTSDPVAGSNVAADTDVTYTVTLQNIGGKAGVVTVSDELPKGLALDVESVKASIADADAAEATEPVADEQPVEADGAQDEAADVADADEAVDALDAADTEVADAPEGETEAAPDAADGGDVADIPDSEALAEVGDASDEAADEAAEAPAADDAVSDDAAEATELAVSETNPVAKFFADLWNGVTGSDDFGITVTSGEISGKAYLEPGQTLTITYTAHVASDVEQGSELANTVVATLEGGSPVSATDTVVVAEPHLVMTKTNTPDDSTTVKPGDTITYSMFVTNDGTAAADGVTLVDTVPEHTTYVAGSAKLVGASDDASEVSEDELVCRDADGNVTGVSALVGEVAPKAKSATLTFQVTVDEDATGVITNVGKFGVGEDERPSDPTKNPTEGGSSEEVKNPTDETEDTPKPATLSVEKHGVDANGNVVESFTAGSEQLWAITVKNSGEEDATNVRVTDVFGDGMTFVSATVDGKVAAAELSGQSSAERAAAASAANAQSAARQADGSYRIGVPGAGKVYALGGATKASGIQYVASAVPAGTYRVAIDSGYQAVISVSAYDADGKAVASGNGSEATSYHFGYENLADSGNVTIPENAVISVRIYTIDSAKTLADREVTDITKRPLTFSAAAGTAPVVETQQAKAAADYSATFTVDVPAGKSVTILVKTKVAADAASKITNRADVYAFATDAKPVDSSAATLTRSSYTESAKKQGSDLPKTAAAFGGVVLLAAGAFLTLGGGAEMVRERVKRSRKGSEVSEQEQEQTTIS